MADNAENFFDSLPNTAAVAALVGQNEDLYLEVKTCGVPFTEQDKNHLSEALSGFANSDGGVLIYGLVARGGDKTTPDLISGVSPVTNVPLVHSQALALVGQLVEPPVQGVIVASRELDRAPDQGFVLIYIPRSDGFLHRARRGREFYRRHGHSFMPMEQYEIAEFYGRRKAPKLRLTWDIRLVSMAGGSPNRIFHCFVTVGLENIGRGIAKYPALRIWNHRPHVFGLDGSGKFGMRQVAGSAPLFFQGGAESVVYPGTTLEVTTLYPQLDLNEQALSCPTVSIDYDIHSEEMQSLSGNLTILPAEFYEKLMAATKKFR